MALPIFPTHRFNPDSVTPKVARRVISGGTALSGEEDVIATDGGGRLEIAYGDIALDTPELQRLWNAWDAFMAGGASVFLVPLVTLSTAPRPFAGRTARPAADFGDDGSDFPQAVGYRNRLIQASLATNAGLRATTLQITIAKGSPIRGGEWFSVGERAHRIERVLSRAGATFTVRTDPPQRAAVSSGTAVEFEWPVVRARLAPDADITPTLAYGLYGDTSVSFVEAA